jgi:hypothetical protein
MKQTMMLTVPAGKEWVMVLRMAAAGVGALYNLPVDVLDDLATAIEESCDLLLHQDYVAEALTMKCCLNCDGLSMCISASERVCQPCDEAADADIAKLILQPLVKEVQLDQDENGVHCVHLTLPAKG